MPSTLEMCEKFFGTTSLYEILEIEKTATVAEGNFFCCNFYLNILNYFNFSLFLFS